jgi:branched-chain amino acid aminotransferase
MAGSGMIDIDGELFAPEDARISVFDRGFLYGDSAFEALRTYGKRPFRERDHLERLERSCERVRIVPPITRAELARRIARAIENSAEPECYLRIVVTRGAGPMGLDLTLAQGPSVVVYALPLKLPDARMYSEGIGVHLVHTVRSTDGGPAAGAKTSNYLASMLALDDAKRHGAHEAIIVDAHGHVVEGTTSNIFIVREGALFTPPVEAGILEGITRRCVFELAVERGLPCREIALRARDVAQASEVFITSSIREIVPVVRVDDVMIGNGKPGATTLALLEGYRAQTRRQR